MIFMEAGLAVLFVVLPFLWAGIGVWAAWRILSQQPSMDGTDYLAMMGAAVLGPLTFVLYIGNPPKERYRGHR